MFTMIKIRMSYWHSRLQYNRHMTLIGASTSGRAISWFHYLVTHMIPLPKLSNRCMICQKQAITRLILIIRITKKSWGWQKLHTAPLFSNHSCSWYHYLVSHLTALSNLLLITHSTKTLSTIQLGLLLASQIVSLFYVVGAIS